MTNLRHKPLATVLIILALATLPAPGGAPAPQQLVGPPTLVTVNATGTATGNDDSRTSPSQLTPNGRFLVFQSRASNLIAFPDANAEEDIFVKDLQTGELTLVSVNAAGSATGNGESRDPVITPDGRFVAFSSTATDLVAGPSDTNARSDIFVRDMQADTTTLVSVNSAGTDTGIQRSVSPQISADGRFVFFLNSDSLDIAGVMEGNDTSSQNDLFVRDLDAAITTLVNFNTAGTASSDSGLFDYSISADGRLVAFLSSATDLAANDTNGTDDVFVRDLDANVTTLVSVNLGGTSSPAALSDSPLIAANGRFVAFVSNATDLVATPDANGAMDDVFVRDLQAGKTTLVSVNSAGTATGNDEVRLLERITPDGRFILFVSNATDMHAGVSDGNGTSGDVFVRDLAAGTTAVVSINNTGAATGNDRAIDADITADGRFVVFESEATDVIAGLTDTNGEEDIFLRDLHNRVTTALSLNSAGTATGNDQSDEPLIAGNGTLVVFGSRSTDLVDLPDGNSSSDQDTYVIAPTDLSLSNSANESVVTQGDSITYTLNVTNSSMFDAHGVLVTDNLPGNTSVTSAPGCTTGGGIVTCAVGTLKSGESVGFTIRVRVGSNAINDLTNRASVSSSSFEVNLSNNSDQVTTSLEGRTELSLSQFISPNPLVAGQPATKRISVTAVGPGAATGVVITDPLPAGLTFVSAPQGCAFAAGAVTCTPGTLFVGQRALYEIQVMVDANAAGSITNVVTATANEADGPAVSSRTVPVNVGGLPIPTPLENGVVDTADFIPFGEPGHGMAPKSLVSIFGSGFIPEGSFSASTIPLPTMLGGLMVTFDGIKAPLLLVRPDLIICQLPMGVTLPSATMIIDNGGFGKAVSAPQEVQVATHSPGVFTLTQDGNGQAIVVHAGTADLAAPVGTVGNSRPATEGDNLTIYANGLGPVDPPIADGANSCDPDGVCLPDSSNVLLHHTLTTPIIRIGGVEVPAENVLFSGASPASVGVNEVVFTVPPGLPTGDAVSLTIEIGGVASKETTMAVE